MPIQHRYDAGRHVEAPGRWLKCSFVSQGELESFAVAVLCATLRRMYSS